ncbi:DNA polymerase [Nocardia cyriacigeorgica]|uniref:DNA polymerase n=1 Tax=Nocardia cyriacigeorgica TaxID=135487 RepID=UPI002453A636|nr:DNA polymerase [Nocardia cyriacigeorgica]
MRELPYKIRGEPVTVRVLENHEDAIDFEHWYTTDPSRVMGLDTETTGLNTYGGDTLRTVQFGTACEGWVIPVEKGELFFNTAGWALTERQGRDFVLQNASFDLQVIEQNMGIRMETLWPNVWDTRIFAHLIDPRGQEEGGTGHGLEQLVREHVDPEVAEEVKGLMGKLAKEHKTTKNLIWSVIDIDHPEYLMYAGMDPVLAVRLFEKLAPQVPVFSRHLVRYEHKLAEICSYLERTGFLLDIEYTSQLAERLHAEEAEAVFHAEAFFDVLSVNSTDQVADALEDLGVKIKGRTPSGKRQVDKKLLDSLTVEDPEIGSVGHLVAAVTEAKRARKWRTTWIDGFLNGADEEGRVHPSINPLRARTARMSITGIPAQTLPSGDWMVRRCFIADPGETIVSVDYKAQELRVLAALSGDPTMREAFATDADLHQLTADASGVPRKVGKTVNFAYVYGSGPKNIADQCGISVPVAKKVIAGFEARYPKVKELTDRLQKEAESNGYVITPTGRRLPVDQSRGYAALNYMIQSTSRDITCRGLINLHEAGFTPYLRLPVHDEVVASIPEAKSRWGAAEIARHMRMEFRGVDIDTDPDVYGMSWGHGYVPEGVTIV